MILHNQAMSKVEAQKVKIWVSIDGYYAAFHEVSFNVCYDVTNNIQLGNEPLGFYKNHEYDSDGADYELRDAYLIDGKYYVKWE